MKFDKLKPGMFLYGTFDFASDLVTSWLVVKHKQVGIVIIDDYWIRPSADKLHRIYDFEVKKNIWNNAGYTYSAHEPARPMRARELIVAIFKKA